MKLDDPVAKYLPTSIKMPTHGDKEITLLDLATHAAGFPGDPDNMTGATVKAQYETYTVEKMCAFRILYVVLTAWHHDCDGIAYNPTTNSFPPAIRGFKHLGEHWYAWAQPEDPITLSQQYEGHKIGEPSGAANGSQSDGSGTNQTSAAA